MMKRTFWKPSPDRRGVALVEFALGLPIILAVGLGGLEYSQYAMAVHKVSQSANAMADNLSRVGARSALSVTQIREADIIDTFRGMDRQASELKIGTYGRVIISSLERNASDGQWIHWQRCIGMLNVPSSFGSAGDGATGTGFAGMGPPGSQVQAPPGTGQAVMFVEVQYDYQPLFSTMILPPTRLNSYSVFVVRTPRDTAVGVTNPSPSATPYTCNRFTAT